MIRPFAPAWPRFLGCFLAADLDLNTYDLTATCDKVAADLIGSYM
jgi:hypothetical protein